MAGEVVDAVLSSFTARDTHNTWHGGCLALAELGRRGLLLPDLLPEVVDVLQRAFVYDKLMGQCSVGANIRDAACYLCWSLARAYDPITLQPFVNKLATGLIIVALFDREIPCRHAAAAAFQEHVGRQGSFPHGIEILTTVDYFAVGIRANAYLKLGPFVASFPEYSVALVDHLVEHKLTHWDTVVRDLAAKTLNLLTQYCVEHCSEHVLHTLLTASIGPVLVARHGAILALGNVIGALVDVARQREQPCTQYIDSSVISSVCSLVGELQGRGLLLGVGGSYMRLALADLVQHMATSRIPVPRDTTEQWLSLLEESLVSNEEDVRGAAVKGLAALWETYYGGEAAGSATEVESHLLPATAIARYLTDLSCERESHAQGMAMGLGVLPLGVLKVHGGAVLQGLLQSSVATPETARWAATRRDAISSTVHIVTTLGLTGPNGVSQDLLDSCLATLLRCLEDYTTDRRGDVGAWVREGAVTAIQSILQLSVLQKEAVTEQSAAPSAEHVSGAVTRMVQLAVERIDRTRRVAGTALAAIIHSHPSISHVPQHEVLLSTLPSDLCSTVNWGSDRDTFEPLSRLLQLPEYRPRLIMGLAYSLGGVSANLAQSSSDALDGHVLQLSEAGDASLAEFVTTVLELLQTPALHDRLQLPLLKTLEHFMTTSSLLDQVLESDECLCQRVLSCLKAACQGCHDYHRLVAISATLSELLRLNSTVTRPLLNQLLLFLGYQYPKVRTVTATSLLTALQDYAPDLLERGELPSQEVLDQLLEILEDTPWMEAPLPLVREKRNTCCRLLGLPVPAVKKKLQQ